MNLVLYRRLKNYQKFLIDMDEDVCQYYIEADRKSSKILDILLPFLKNTSNIYHPCPYTNLIYIHNMNLATLSIENAPLPIGQYRVDIKFYDSLKNKTIFITQLFFRVNNN